MQVEREGATAARPVLGGTHLDGTPAGGGHDVVGETVGEPGERGRCRFTVARREGQGRGREGQERGRGPGRLPADTCAHVESVSPKRVILGK